jgi:hypothetical protein
MGGSTALVFGLTAPVRKTKPQKSIYYVPDTEYETECAACHIAFLPGFLPTRSWTKMMDTLENHFGENAALDPEPKDRILRYLVANGTDSKRSSPRSKRIGKLIPINQSPLRITETPFWVRRHGSIRDWVWKRKDVTSKAKCDSCHREAKTGVFEDHNVSVPKDQWWEW